MINSSRTKFTFKFTVEPTELKKKPKIYKRRTKNEAFAFMFGERLYDINTYNKPSTVMDAFGIGLIFTRPKGSPIGKVFLKEFHNTSAMYNLQAAYKEKINKAWTCDYDYMEKLTVLVVDFDFKGGMASFYLNDKLCFNYIINRNQFPEEKLSYSFFGYSLGKSPIRIGFEDVIVKKLMRKNLNKKKDMSFHASPKNVIDVRIYLLFCFSIKDLLLIDSIFITTTLIL